MAAENAQRNGLGIATAGQDHRVALAGGGIRIRREGKPLESMVLRGGSAYLVIDCSDSMEGEKITQAKRGALDFAQEALTKSYAVGLISFASAAVHICGLQEDASNVRRCLPGLKLDGSTNMADGIELAAAQLKGRPGPLAMVVVTDGVPNDQKAALRAARDAKSSGIDIITVGTDDADQGFLQKLASRADLVVAVDTSGQLGKGISTAAGMLPRGSSLSPER